MGRMDGRVPCSGHARQRVRLETEQPICRVQVPWSTRSSIRLTAVVGQFRFAADSFRSGASPNPAGLGDGRYKDEKSLLRIG